MGMEGDASLEGILILLVNRTKENRAIGIRANRAGIEGEMDVFEETLRTRLHE
jgi:hypothetical protein